MYNQTLRSELRGEWSRIHGKDPDSEYFCPGRVNLIGEHLDYNGGPVLPLAIERGIYCLYREGRGRKISFASTSRTERLEFDLDNLEELQHHFEGSEWTRYPLAVILVLEERGIHIAGGDYLFASDLPIGAGLSSSAALEVLTAFAAISHSDNASLDLTGIALASQQAEVTKVGVQCGIMDQFAVACGKRDHAILLDCKDLSARFIPFKLKNKLLAVINSKKSRELASSAYNERRQQCEEAAAIISEHRPIRVLAQADQRDLEYLSGNPILYRRAKHVITEHARVLEAVKKLEQSDLEELGLLLNESHMSLKNDYEVSGRELDLIAESASEIPGCLGARMTGAGFGGCAIALIEESTRESFETELKRIYSAKTGVEPEILYTRAVDGVREIL